MEKNISKKRYVPPFAELLSVDEDTDVMITGTGTNQPAGGSEKDDWGQGAKESFGFQDDNEEEETNETGW